ncbi:hypothetical protein MMC22_007205 [Lobaria immixta]|nr:hypothetical protein [Lobaria immixta]
MSSGLRYSMSASSTQAAPVVQRTISSPPPKKQKMSITQTYYLAHTARGKLSKEAARSDHDLRLLVGHANLLDGLMLDLADAEREQESWFNSTVRGAAKASDEPKHIQWAETIPEEVFEEDEESEAETDSDSESDDEDVQYAQPIPLRRRPQITTVTAVELDDEDMEDDEDYEDDLALTRTASHPPELLHESDSESEDDSMPPSPPQTEMPLDAFSEKQRQAIATTSFYQSMSESSPASLPASEQASFFDEGFYLPQRQTAIVSAY